MKRIFYAFALLAIAIFAGCSKPEMQKPTSSPVTIEKGENSPGYPGAQISIISPKAGEILKDDSVNVVIDLSSYEIGIPTDGDKDKGLAFSKPDTAHPNAPFGQHVHIIVDNEPYMACYIKGQPFAIPKRLAPGMHTLRVFPSRSWHESVKQPGCFAMETFYVTYKTGDSVDWTKPFITYSRPKGEYSGAGAKKILIDWYVSNCTLAPDGYKAKITVDTTSVTATEWVPYFAEGLAPGDHTVQVDLLAPDGSVVAGAWNSTQRKITVK